MDLYISTRGEAPSVDFETALLVGLAPDGGLYVPRLWPAIPGGVGSLRGADYATTAARVLAPFVGGAFTVAELQAMCERVYARFDHAAVAPLVQTDADSWMLELFHGPTLAFKDFALQLLGEMFDAVLARRGRRLTIVGATSGDTGAAAIGALKGRAAVDVVILHPEGRISEVQRRQMTTASEPNVLNIAVEGSFDDCQDLVKAMFADVSFRDEVGLSGINSINWARIAAQSVYYVYAGVRLGLDRPAVYVVPTGNFGNVLAGYVAWRMGLPVKKLVVATNVNDILARTFASGRYATDGVQPSYSPSMDIQVASNFERLLFDALDRDANAVRRLMAQFKQSRGFDVPANAMAWMRGLFAAERTDEDQTVATIKRAKARGLGEIDPHTAVGLQVAERLAPTVEAPVVTLATAHAAKFPDAMATALGAPTPLTPRLREHYECAERMTRLPNDLDAVQAAIRTHLEASR